MGNKTGKISLDVVNFSNIEETKNNDRTFRWTWVRQTWNSEKDLGWTYTADSLAYRWYLKPWEWT